MVPVITVRTVSAHISSKAARIAVASLAIMAAGCRYNVADDYDAEVEMKFVPVMYQSVKSAAGEYPEGQTFGVSAWTYAPEASWKSGKSYIIDSPVTQSGEAGGQWMLPATTLWPDKKVMVAVMAYSPFGSATSIDTEGGVVWRDIDTMEDQTDYLYVDPRTDLRKFADGGIVNLPFRHAQSEVDFTIINSIDNVESVTLKRLSITDMAHKGSFASLPSAHWDCTDEKAEIVFFEGEAQVGMSPVRIGKTLKVIPQTLHSTIQATFTIQYQEGGQQTYTLSSRLLEKTLEAGRHYSFTTSIRPDNLSLAIDIISDFYSEM